MNSSVASRVGPITLAIGLLMLMNVSSSVVATGLTLRWGSGSTSLTVGSDLRTTVVLSRDSLESALPTDWKLIATTDSAALVFTAVDSLTACETAAARLASITPPLTLADSAASEVTAEFCSANGASADAAYYFVDIVGGTRGKLKAVAINPTNPDAVIESNEITYRVIRQWCGWNHELAGMQTGWRSSPPQWK